MDLYIEIIKNPANNTVLYLLLHEQTNPVENHRPITRVACQQGELMLVRLLLDYWNTPARSEAAMVSRLVTSSLIALSEHPSFAPMSLGLEPEASLPDTAWDTIRAYTLTSLKAFCPAAATTPAEEFPPSEVL